MTPNQKQRLELKIKKIQAALVTEKRIYGCYDDSRGLWYLISIGRQLINEI